MRTTRNPNQKHNRKRKKKHIKLTTIGGIATVQFGSKKVSITVVIPREHLKKRL